jgi:hypothetical protein
MLETTSHWNGAAHPTAMAMVRWVSKSNDDSLYGGIDSINNGKFKAGHDNLQQFNLTWTHRFNETGTFVTATEAYYIYQSHALVGNRQQWPGSCLVRKCTCRRCDPRECSRNWVRQLHRMEILKEGFPDASSVGHSGRQEGRTNRIPDNLRELDRGSHAPLHRVDLRSSGSAV